MIRSFRRSLALLLAALLFLAPAALFGAPKVDWEVIKVGNRDWLTVDNVAQFYNLPTGVQPVEKVILLSNGQQNMQVRLDSREIVLNGVRNWLSFPVIEHEGRYMISRLDLAKTIEPQMRPHMIANLSKVSTVIIDPGHGGFDKGAGSIYGHEKNFALDVAKQLRPLLEAKGFKVILTRESDVFIPLHIRARIANSVPDSVFVSIHFNATNADLHANGFEIFSLTPRAAPSTDDNALELRFMNVSNGTAVDSSSLGLSTSIYHSMLGNLGKFDRGIKRARFAVLRHTKVPAVLVEGGFVSHREESKAIGNREWRGKLAQAICTGVEQYRALAHNRTKPMLLADYRRDTGQNMLASNTILPPAPSSVPSEFAAVSQTPGETAEEEPDAATAAPTEEAPVEADVPADIAEKLGLNSSPPPAVVVPVEQPPAPVAAPLVDPALPVAPAPASSPAPVAAPTPRILNFSPPPKFQP